MRCQHQHMEFNSIIFNKNSSNILIHTRVRTSRRLISYHEKNFLVELQLQIHLKKYITKVCSFIYNMFIKKISKKNMIYQ